MSDLAIIKSIFQRVGVPFETERDMDGDDVTVINLYVGGTLEPTMVFSTRGELWTVLDVDTHNWEHKTDDVELARHLRRVRREG